MSDEGPRIVGLIAAAGESSRMGAPKALLPFASGPRPHPTFVTVLVDAFFAAGLDRVVVTLPEGTAGESVRAHLSRRDHDEGRLVVVGNRAPSLGLSGSVLTAIDAVEDAAGLVLTPVDAPFASPGLVRALAGALKEGARAAVVNHRGLRGHPVAIARSLFDDVEEAAHRGGLRDLLDATEPGALVEIASDDARVLVNVNTKEEYRAAFGCYPPAP